MRIFLSLTITCKRDEHLKRVAGTLSADQIHRLRNKTTRHADVDRGLLSVASQHPDLDARKLQGVNRIRYALL